MTRLKEIVPRPKKSIFFEKLYFDDSTKKKVPRPNNCRFFGTNLIGREGKFYCF